MVCVHIHVCMYVWVHVCCGGFGGGFKVQQAWVRGDDDGDVWFRAMSGLAVWCRERFQACRMAYNEDPAISGLGFRGLGFRV